MNGKTIDMKKIDLMYLFRGPLPDRDKVERDRSLRGKARIKARKAARR